MDGTYILMSVYKFTILRSLHIESTKAFALPTKWIFTHQYIC